MCKITQKDLLILLMLCLFAQPCLAAHAKKEVKRGNLLYNKGKFSQALKSYEKALADLPDSDIVNFNLGAAMYKAEAYRKAMGHFERALVSEDKSLEQKASYNIGNSKYKYGIGWEDTNISNAIKLLEQSLRHYEHAIKLDAEDEDAKYNYEFVKKELERLKKKQKQQQPQQQQQKQQQPQQQPQQSPQQEQQQDQDQDKDQDQQQPKQPDEPSKDKEKDDENGGPEEEADQPPGQGKGSQPPPGKMSEQEAEMLLENYSQEEEPRGLFKEKMPAIGLPETLKDW